ncbi:MAG: hypothetical protein PUF13_02975, partial [Lachnospiraceae bacterium]|nr:hypothetical protein [Lachnospiraceae bacterium]
NNREEKVYFEAPASETEETEEVQESEETEESNETKDSETQEEEQTQETQSGETDPEETDDQQSQTEEQMQEEMPAGDADAPGAEERSPVTLSEALGLEHIQAVYTGTQLTDRYDSVVPDSGKKLMILHVTLQNRTKKARKCDILSLLPVFRAKVNGTQEVTAELTILPENLSTWESKIPAGGSADTIILFQVKEDAVQSVDQLELEVMAGEKTSRVVFL